MTSPRLSGLAPKVPLAQLPTPLQPLDRLSEELGGPQIVVKRDDLTGLALGGNKARKLEYLCADAEAAGADILVTGGGHQSNHARMTAAAANRLGIDCHLVLGGNRPEVFDGNLVVDALLGATLEFCGAEDYYGVEAAIGQAADRLEGAGRRPFAVPIGGASATGALSYVEAADELTDQEGARGVTVSHIFVPDGSGGTHAGLLAGVGTRVEIVGIDVGTRPDLDEYVPALAAETASLGSRAAPPAEAVIDHGRFGPGYGSLTEEGIEAIRMVARLEGLVLDPVYTGKAMAGLIGWIREGRVDDRHCVVFWHTGGSPALFARRYADRLSSG